jgi:hypothetical protein
MQGAGGALLGFPRAQMFVSFLVHWMMEVGWPSTNDLFVNREANGCLFFSYLSPGTTGLSVVSSKVPGAVLCTSHSAASSSMCRFSPLNNLVL